MGDRTGLAVAATQRRGLKEPKIGRGASGAIEREAVAVLCPSLRIGTRSCRVAAMRSALVRTRIGFQPPPRAATPWFYLGEMYRVQNRTAEAVSSFEHAIELAQRRPSSAFTVDGLRMRVQKLRQPAAPGTQP